MMPVSVKIWGDYACFTRPEMKVERVSYDVITPSAARGVLEAIFWKPEFFWMIRRIEVLKSIRTFSLVRNEVKTLASTRGTPINIGDDRTQRHTLGLRDVAYIIHADAVLRDHATDDVAKYRDQFRRRLDKGQCYHRPYLGCREFACDFSKPDGADTPIDMTADLGYMLLDIEYTKTGMTPHFFRAEINEGVIEVPEVRFNTVGMKQ
ncbi:MAG: type I-C CRISPR-associated protein Cas5c [Armatimonadota bacterium]